MISPQLGTVYLLVLISGTLWTLGETCIPGTFTANPDICNQYYLCIDSGEATMNVPLKCKDGYNFDPSKALCTTSYKCLICD